MKTFSDIIRPQARVSMWDWNVENVDFSLDAGYRAATGGKYDAGLMPWWRGIVDAIDSRDIKEVVVLGISQGGKEEHCLCFPVRYWAGTNQQLHVLYVGHQEDKSAEIFIDRVKGSMKLTRPTRNLLGTVHERGMVYEIGATRFGCTHGSTGGGLKGKPWDRVLCSEVSSFKSVAILDEARKRGITRPFFKLVMWGCPDWRQNRPSDADPLFMEFEQTPMAEWSMPDPKTGELFFWRAGDGTADGIYFDKAAKRDDGSYDLKLVEDSAFYVTPSGTRIDKADRWGVVKSGAWVAQKPDAPPWKFGAHVHQLMMPWEDVGGFGHIARRLIESRMKGQESYRAFRYEVEAAKWYGEKTVIEVDEIQNRRGSYPHKTRAGQHPAYAAQAAKRSIILMTVDVQKDYFVATVREWFDGGDSALIEFGQFSQWKELQERAAKHGAAKVFIDLGYSERRNECLEQAVFGEMKGAVPMFGRDALKEAFRVDRRDPFEGTARQGRTRLPVVTFCPNQIKHILLNLVMGKDSHLWMIPADVPAEYIMQMSSEEWIDGSWKKRRRDNHAWDAECMQLVAAMALGAFRQVAVNLDTGGPETVVAPTVPAPKRTTRGVYYPD